MSVRGRRRGSGSNAPCRSEITVSSWLKTDRQYAYFKAVGVDDPNDVSFVLDLEPDEIWKLGDAFERGSLKSRRRSSRWMLNSGLSDAEPLSDHLRALMCRLEPKREGLLSLQDRFATRFVCVAYCYQAFGWELDFDLQRRATALRVSFEFDIYRQGDHHEEIVELREQLNARGSSRT